MGRASCFSAASPSASLIMLALGVALAQLGVALTALALLVASSARLDERKPDERKTGGGAPRKPDARRADCARAFSATISSQLRLVVVSCCLALLFGDAPSSACWRLPSLGV